MVESMPSNCNRRWGTGQTRSTKHAPRTVVPHNKGSRTLKLQKMDVTLY